MDPSSAGTSSELRNDPRRSRNHIEGLRTRGSSRQPSMLIPRNAGGRMSTVGGGGFQFMSDSYSDIRFDKDANETAAEFIRDKIRQQVKDPKVAELLCRDTYPYATKRPPLETNYYKTFNRDNVTLVDLLSTPLLRIVEAGVETSETVYELDGVVLATGFDAMTGPLLRMGVRGRNGLNLGECWEHGRAPI